MFSYEDLLLPVECHDGFRSDPSLHIAHSRKSELNAIDRLKMREWDKIRYSVKTMEGRKKSWECKKQEAERTENSYDYIIQRYQFSHINHLQCECHKRDENRIRTK